MLVNQPVSVGVVFVRFFHVTPFFEQSVFSIKQSFFSQAELLHLRRYGYLAHTRTHLLFHVVTM